MLGEYFDHDLPLLAAVARGLVGDESQPCFAVGEFQRRDLQCGQLTRGRAADSLSAVLGKKPSKNAGPMAVL